VARLSGPCVVTQDVINVKRYYRDVLTEQSFRDTETLRLWRRESARRFGAEVQGLAWRRLAHLDAAERIADLAVPPGNQLARLKGDRVGYGSMRLNDHCRICFQWGATGPHDIELVNDRPGEHMTDTDDPITDLIGPGALLMTDFLEPLGISQYRLAQAIGVPARRINEIVHGSRRISPDTALRLSRYFGMSDGFWLNLQGRYDLEVEKVRLSETLNDIEPLAVAS
jgi:addiction module HigA family antidote